MKEFPTIESSRLVMRELSLKDVEAVFKHFSKPEVTQFMDIEACKHMKEAEEIITFHRNDSGCRYGLFSKDNNELIGTCGFHCWIIDSNHSCAEIGFDLSPDFWGKGYMHESLCEVLKIGFYIMKLDYIEATTEVDNMNSQRLLEKMGFVQEPSLRDNLFYYTLQRNNWLAVG